MLDFRKIVREGQIGVNYFAESRNNADSVLDIGAECASMVVVADEKLAERDRR